MSGLDIFIKSYRQSILVEDSSSSSVKNAKNIQLTKMKMKRKQPLLLQQERLKLIYMSNLL